MYLISDSFHHYDWIPARYALGRHHPTEHFQTADNASPHLTWGHVPESTRSFAILCFDPDVPTRPDDVNQPDREVPATLPRGVFWHWVLADVPSGTRALAEGAGGVGVTLKGKGPQAATLGTPGLNDYTNWFAGDPDMGGQWFGYDGPAPPWNDSRVHGYHFQILALDVPTLGLSGPFTGDDLKAAAEGHILGKATLVGLYAINPAARARHRGA